MSQALEWTPLDTWFAAQWTATPIHRGRNYAFDADKAADTAPHDPGGPWIRTTTRAKGGGDYQLFTVEVSTAIRERELLVDVFYPIGTGTAIGGAHAETLRDMLWDLELGVMTFGVASIHDMPEEKGSKWGRQQVRVDYEYEEWKGESNVNIGHEREITQAGFFAGKAIGDLVYISGADTLALAKADAQATLATHMISRVISDDRGAIVAPGCNLAWTGHGGSAGNKLYTSATTAGEMTTTAPIFPNFEQQIGGVNADSTFWFFLFQVQRGATA